MANYYILEASKNVSEYVRVIENTRDIAKACQMSEFQFFDPNPISLEVDEDSGRVFQDFLYDSGVPLISDKMKDILDTLNIDYLLFKKVLLTKKRSGIEEIYWLALPPRINVLNRELSNIDDILDVADEIVINDERVGRYEMFKLAGVGNLEIVVSERIAKALRDAKLVGLHIYKTD